MNNAFILLFLLGVLYFNFIFLFVGFFFLCFLFWGKILKVTNLFIFPKVLIVKFMVPSIDSLNLNFVASLNTHMDDQEYVEKIKFSVFIILIVVVFFLIWTPYLRNLNTKIWRTKGMLNMIPMDIISKNENLKNAFISGDILQAVK